MDEIRTLGYCSECGDVIYDDSDYYTNEDGEYFCDIECVLEHYNVYKIEV